VSSQDVEMPAVPDGCGKGVDREMLDPSIVSTCLRGRDGAVRS